MSKRESGTYPLEELTSDIDGTTAYRTTGEFQRAAISDSWNTANREIDDSIMWSVEDLDDDDDLDISITPELLAVLWSKARAYDRIMSLCIHAPRCECE